MKLVNFLQHTNKLLIKISKYEKKQKIYNIFFSFKN